MMKRVPSIVVVLACVTGLLAWSDPAGAKRKFTSWVVMKDHVITHWVFACPPNEPGGSSLVVGLGSSKLDLPDDVLEEIDEKITELEGEYGVTVKSKTKVEGYVCKSDEVAVKLEVPEDDPTAKDICDKIHEYYNK